MSKKCVGKNILYRQVHPRNVKPEISFRETHEKEQEALSFLEGVLAKNSNVVVASSFGKDSMVVLHLCLRIDPDIKGFMVTTPNKPVDTIVFRQHVIKEWDLSWQKFQVFRSEEPAPDKLYLTDPKECCRINKVEPLRKALKELKPYAWISGLRGTESDERLEKHSKIEEQYGIVKINPILDWTELDVWKYTAIHNIPVNPLYSKGYRSLGCTPCMAPGGELERSGRWQNTPLEGGECGIHTLETSDA
ncbi:MAG: phosphoadenylyl-sulfate reductase [Candidatus Marinimicrobia bacterium]|nr:phosphoadenylyl-sulfate reductase [Candidatus Neomarinimicrobiota bacterium]